LAPGFAPSKAALMATIVGSGSTWESAGLLAGVATSARFEEVAPFASRISSEIWSISSDAEVIRASESELTFSLVAISRILAALKSRSSLDFCEM